MQELIEAIRIAVATEASPEQKAAGVQACRTIVAALDTEPGKPIMLPGTPPTVTTSLVSVDQMLDLVISRLTKIATERDAQPVAVPTIVPVRGLRVPVTPTTLPRGPTKPAVHVKRSTPIARKP